MRQRRKKDRGNNKEIREKRKKKTNRERGKERKQRSDSDPKTTGVRTEDKGITEIEKSLWRHGW